MKANQMSDGERKTYTWLVNETKPELRKYQCEVISASIVIFLVGLGAIIWCWISPTVSYSTSLLIGGLFYAWYGTLLLALGAISSPITLGRMSMTRWDGNPKLFEELMRSRFSAHIGIWFLVGAFAIQLLGVGLLGSC